jgi:glycosyltransferase involved in cell wall biosynthesis
MVRNNLRLGYAIATFPNEVEWWARLEVEELTRIGMEPYIWTFRGDHSRIDVDRLKECDFNIYHYAQVALRWKHYKKPFCILPHAHDIFRDNGMTLKQAADTKLCKFIGYQSLYHKQKFEEWGIDKPLVYIPTCCRTSLFQRSSLGLGSKIVAGGRLIPKKGLGRVIPHLDNLTIFGVGDMKEQLMKMNKTTTFTGWLDGQGLRDLFEESWLYVFPAIQTSDGDSDGIANTVKEALLMQLQVVTSSVAGMSEVKGVHVFDDWTYKGIHKMIESIPREPNLIGEKYVREIYNPQICVERLLKAVDEYGNL